jgi:hypothetical protein
MEQHSAALMKILCNSFSVLSHLFLLYDRRCVSGRREMWKETQNISKTHGGYRSEALINSALFWTTFHSVRAVFTSHSTLYLNCSTANKRNMEEIGELTFSKFRRYGLAAQRTILWASKDLPSAAKVTSTRSPWHLSS